MLSLPLWLVPPGATTLFEILATYVLLQQLGLVAKDDICTCFSFIPNDKKYS